MEFSFIIATFDRCDFLLRLLSGIAINFHKREIAHEVIVANNARDERIAKRIDDVVDKIRHEHGNRFLSVREPNPGKCRAQNAAIGRAKGEILPFFDDDVEVTPEWIDVAAEFFRTKSFDVMQGPILIPPQMRDNDTLLRLQHRYRTINFVQYPANMTEIKTLTGANMAIRRPIFSRVGYFNEDLAPVDREFRKTLSSLSE